MINLYLDKNPRYSSCGQIPQHLLEVRYVASRVPGCANQGDLSLGANCQVFAYAVLLHFGISLPNFRSSDLWKDDCHTEFVSTPKILDLMLYNRNELAFGAHLGVYWGEGNILHLSKRNGVPKIERHSDLVASDHYGYFIGIKRATSLREA